jgi:hypothetical protein
MTASNEISFNGVKLAWVRWVIELIVFAVIITLAFSAYGAKIQVIDTRLQSVEKTVDKLDQRMANHIEAKP